ncbi:flagellin [Luminiphilus sp.]|nr:flagellin [Luminiphilus sp.]
MAVVNTNIGSSLAQAALMKNERSLSTAMEQLSTGKRINAAGDDASGLAISARMTSQIRGLETSIRNANDAISMVDTAEGALDEITEMLQRIRELAVQSGTGTTHADDRTYMDAEFNALRDEIERVANNTEWNGTAIIKGTVGSAGTVTYQVGVDGGNTLAVDFGDMTKGTGSMASLNGGSVGLNGGTVASGITLAASVITITDTAIDAVSNQRSTFGATSNRLTHAVDNLTNVKVNAEASRSRILDTDYAAATSELARTQIIQQAGTAMLAQANQMPQSVLALLQ